MSQGYYLNKKLSWSIRKIISIIFDEYNSLTL